jgi:hypothetical protein
MFSIATFSKLFFLIPKTLLQSTIYTGEICDEIATKPALALAAKMVFHSHLEELKVLDKLNRKGEEQSFDHRHLSNIDCLMTRTAYLVCFIISTVNGHSKKKRLKCGTSSGAHNKP